MNGRALRGAAAVVLAAAASLPAHHSPAAEYDLNTSITLDGRITRVEWTNPHLFLELDCPTPDGGVSSWRVEAASPAMLAQAEITRESLAINSAVSIQGARAKNGSPKAYGVYITFANGETKRLDGSPRTAAAPSTIDQLASAQPWLPYLVGAVPVVVLIAGLVALRRRRQAATRSVPQ